MPLTRRLILAALVLAAGTAAHAQPTTRLNVSHVVAREFGAGKVDVIHPSASLATENPVAVVERTAAKRGSSALARAYLEFLYTPQAQEIAARHVICPRDPEVLKRHGAVFQPIRLFTAADCFGSLAEAQRVHFNDGGTFDRLYQRPAP